MHLSIITVFLMLLAPFSFSAEPRIYVACSKKGDAPSGIFLTSLNEETGLLQLLKRVATAENTSFLAISETGHFLYSVSEGKDGRVVAWSVAEDGSLTKINDQPTNGADPCHLALSPSGSTLLVANYSGGSLAAFPIHKSGALAPMTSFFQLTGSGPNPKRQTQPHAHGIYCDPTGKWAYIPDLGTDRVWIYRLDESKSTLTPNDPAYASLPPGSGPRHLAFSRDGKRVFVNGEMGLNIATFQLDAATGALQNPELVPVFPLGLTLPENADTAEVVVHPDGKTLYVSTRGYSSLSSFRIAPDGVLAYLENIPLSVQGPRHFSISPNGKWLIVPGQRSHQITVLALDPATGKLQPTSQLIEANGPQCVLFAP